MIDQIAAFMEDFENIRRIQSDYVRLPPSLAEHLGISQSAHDAFGVEPRHELIRKFLADRQPLGGLVDIGGSSGYFALSLLDEGLVEETTVYDVVPEVLEFGTRTAEMMGLSQRAGFVKMSVTLDGLVNLPDADVVICQNLIHHAGALFDWDAVRHLGWERYAVAFMSELRRKYRFAVVGVGFKGKKPAMWSSPVSNRVDRFREIVHRAGWSNQFDGNVYDIAHGIRPAHMPLRTALSVAAWRLGGFRAEQFIRARVGPHLRDKMDKYHIFLLA